jgi:cytochrome c oxidase cbb3-type subunit III
MKMLIFYLFFVLYFVPIVPLANAESARDGRALYFYWCTQCHGVAGRGDGVNSTPDMRINPRDHTDASYMSTRTDQQLEDVIKGGGVSISKSSIMPPWQSTLTDKEIKSVVLYLRKLCNCQFDGVISDEKLRKTSPDFK